LADFGALIGGIGQSGFIGRAIVGLDLDTKKYQAEMAAAKGQTTAATQQMGGSFSRFGGIASAAMKVGAAAVVVGAVAAVKAASDLGEAINKNKVIFEDNAAAIEQWAGTGAEAFGLSKSEALSAAAGFGAMAQTAGIAVGESANMSKSLVQLAGDMASFNNEDPSEMLERLRSGLAGEAEPLRRFGVFISEARVETEAFASGIAKTGEELTDAQKVQARYNLILQDTTKQSGDFQRTFGESLPNQMRALKAELINTAAAIGTELLPAALALMKALRDLLPVIAPLLEALGKIITLGAEAISVLAKVVTLNFGELESGIVDASKTFERLVTQFDAGEISALEFGNAIHRLQEETGLNVDLTAEWEQQIHSARDGVSRMSQAQVEWTAIMEAQGKATEETGKKIFEFANMTGDELEKWKTTTTGAWEASILALEDLTTETGLTEDDFITAHEAMLTEAKEFAGAMRSIAKERWINDEYIKFLSEQGPEWIIQFANLTETQQRRAQEAWQQTTNKTDSLVTVLDRLVRVLKDLDGKTTHHKVRVEYEYAGYDPSKPGMPGVQRAGTTGQGTNIVNP
jgi:hypothetical protein